MLKKEKYNKFSIYTYEDYFIEIAKKILNKEFKEIKILKNSKRNFVSLIEVNNKKYVYKEPRNEYIIPQRKFLTFFKNGEALTTLVNINNLKEDIQKYYALPLLAVNIRKNGFIDFSFLLMEYIDGEEDRKQISRTIEIMSKIHDYRVYHGDFNPSNFLYSKENNLKIIDTQAKKMTFGNYRAHYDMLTMIWDSFRELEYPYEKNIFYYLAVFFKKIKKLKFVEKIKEKKKKLREKGWKI